MRVIKGEWLPAIVTCKEMAAAPPAKKLCSGELPPSVAKDRFPGRVAIVTGGASGIGLATVERLAGEGATVAIFDINQDAGEKVVADFKARDLKVSYHKVDVSDQEQCADSVKAVMEANSGKLHFLVNSAAYFGQKGLTATRQDWDKSLSVNIIGYANMVQACHPYLQKTPGDKSIVNLSSLSGCIAQPGYWTYSATKGAITSMTRCMALDFAPDAIRVNSVSPACVWTPQMDKLTYNCGGREKWGPVFGAFLMLGRVAESEEIASSVCFLLSEDSSFMTGSDMKVDGGYGSMGPEGMGNRSMITGSDY